MALRKKLIVGNWKMNLTINEASVYVHHLSHSVAIRRNVEVVISPTFLALPTVALQVNRRQFKLAAQNFHWRDEGAFTGEVSAAQLRGLVEYAIIGHSERRHIFRETDKDVRAKVQSAIRNRLTPILCVGETAHQRADGETTDILHDQLVGGLANVTSEEIETLVIAYEPVWAIGTGKNAMPADVKKAIRAIRSQVRHLYGAKAAEAVRVLYGGSVTASSATAYLETEGVDGLLIGGASLKEGEFVAITEQANDVAVKERDE